MIGSYQGPYSYGQLFIQLSAPAKTGIYYCGYLVNNTLQPLYIGMSSDQNGIKGRLLDHINSKRWSDVTHYGYILCDTDFEAKYLEESEIKKHQPKYNIQNKYNY